jgi:phosphohistidine phosphatase
MKELCIIRHGLAGNGMEDERRDEKRPLTAQGKVKMKGVAGGLKRLGVSFDVILTSPLTGATETAEIVDEYCGNGREPLRTDLLKPGASFDKLIARLNTLDRVDRVALVGHESSLSEFASYCLSAALGSFISLKKGGVLMLEVHGRLKPGECTLSWLMKPSQLVELSEGTATRGAS